MPYLVSLLLILISCGKSSRGDESVSDFQGITTMYDLPAFANVTIKNDETVEASFTGVRRIDQSTSVNSEDAFHLGSCTKAMTATLAGVLIEEGLLNWNDTLSQLLPDLVLHDNFKDVPFDFLLAHRAGIASEENALFEKIHPMNGLDGKETILKELLSRSPLYSPGVTSQYSNYGYIIAGRIFERLTGKTFEDLMIEKIFIPLDMKSCGFGPAPQVFGHLRMNGKLIPQGGDNPEAFSPAGRVHCNLSDWGKFLKIHLHGFKGESSLVSSATFKKLHSRHPMNDSMFTYGGWLLVQKSWANGYALTHAGSNTSNYANVWIAPGIDSIFMSVTNVGGEDAFKATDTAIGNMINAHQVND